MSYVDGLQNQPEGHPVIFHCDSSNCCSKMLIVICFFKYRPCTIFDLKNWNFQVLIGFTGDLCIILLNFVAIACIIAAKWPFLNFRMTAVMWKIRNFNGWWGSGDQYASQCQISWPLVKPLSTYGDFSFFSKWRPSAVLDLLCMCLDHRQWVLGVGALYRLAEFGWNRHGYWRYASSVLWEFGLKMPIQGPFGGIFGGKIGVNTNFAFLSL